MFSKLHPLDAFSTGYFQLGVGLFGQDSFGVKLVLCQICLSIHSSMDYFYLSKLFIQLSVISYTYFIIFNESVKVKVT